MLQLADTATLALTSVVWVALLTLLLLDLKLKRLRSRLIIAGVLTATTGGLLGQVARHLDWPNGTAVAADGIAMLLGLTGLICIVIDAGRGPRQAVTNGRSVRTATGQ